MIFFIIVEKLSRVAQGQEIKLVYKLLRAPNHTFKVVFCWDRSFQHMCGPYLLFSPTEFLEECTKSNLTIV